MRILHVLSSLGLLVFLSAGVSLEGQSPYELNWKKELPVLSGGFTLLGIGGELEENLAGYTLHQLESLELPAATPYLDARATGYWSPTAQTWSDHLLHGSMALPIVLLLDADIRSDAGNIGVLLSETVLITQGLTVFSKNLFKRNRPFLFNDEAPLAAKQDLNARQSFFSGHTSTTASLTFFTAKVWSDYHPDSRWKSLVWIAAAIVPAATGYLRYRGGKHYASDVLAGYALGATTGILIPHFHKMDHQGLKNLRLSSSIYEDVPMFTLRYRF